MITIQTIDGNSRMPTQELLQRIDAAVSRGESEFFIEASGQHDIGGPLWHPEGKPLKFTVKNPGQRVGSMCLPGTEVVVEGAAAADVGWLNAGGKIVVKGDGGDTTAHCAAGGIIYIGGRAGARSGSLMKRDPLEAPPEFWVLKSVGSFSYEFMSGGIAVVCGWDCQPEESVLGDRSCVGMVGGRLYFRGRAGGISLKDVRTSPLEAEDITYLASRMDDFLRSIGRPEVTAALTDWAQWQKVIPLAYEERPKKANTNIPAFRRDHWISGGLFSDVCKDDGQVAGLVANGACRQRVPVWQGSREDSPGKTACSDCKLCLKLCPEHAIIRRSENGQHRYEANGERCIGCGVCNGVCPQKAWKMCANVDSI